MAIKTRDQETSIPNGRNAAKGKNDLELMLAVTLWAELDPLL